MFRLKGKRDGKIGQKQAEAFLGFNTFPIQRPLNENKIKEYEWKMRNGLWRKCDIDFAYVDGQQRIMVNGQHQCHAIIRSDKIVLADILDWDCDDLDDVAVLYRQYDVGYSRTNVQNGLVEAHAMHVSWKKRIVSLLLASIKRYVGVSKVPDQNTQISLMREFEKEGQFMEDVVGYHTQSQFMAKAVIGEAMIYCFRKNPNDAHTFWTMVKNGDKDKTESAWLFREFLLRAKLTTHAKYDPSISIVHDDEILRRACWAWNKFRKGGNRLTRLGIEKDLKLRWL